MKFLKNSYKKHQDGFTLIEVVTVTVIMGFAIFFLFSTLWSMLSTTGVDRERLIMIHDKQRAMSIIESDVALSSRFLGALESGLTDPYPPTSNSGAWSYRGDTPTLRYLLLRTYSTNANPLSASRQPVFIGSGSACDPANLYFNNVQRYDIIYFVTNGNLYRRRVVDAATATCSTQYQKLSCPSAADLGASQNASCKADDELLLKNVTTFYVDYYATKDSTSPLDVYAPGPGQTLVQSAVDIELTIGVSQRVSGNTVTSTSKLRMTKLNQDL